MFENGSKGPRIRMIKYHPRINDEINIFLKRFDFQIFHHYCFLFTSQAQFPYPGGYVNLTNKAYIDGKLVNEGKSHYREPESKQTPDLLGQALQKWHPGILT